MYWEEEDVNVGLDISIEEEGVLKLTEVSIQETERPLVEISKYSSEFHINWAWDVQNLPWMKTGRLKNGSPQRYPHASMKLRRDSLKIDKPLSRLTKKGREETQISKINIDRS